MRGIKLEVVKIHPLSGRILEKYESMAEAARVNYISKSSIQACINRSTKTAAGFKWEKAM